MCALLQVQGSWSSIGGLEERIEKGEGDFSDKKNRQDTQTYRQDTQTIKADKTHRQDTQTNTHTRAARLGERIVKGEIFLGLTLWLLWSEPSMLL